MSVNTLPVRLSICTWPHCDPYTLHAPGQCDFCDKFPDLQFIRKRWGLDFTAVRKPQATDECSRCHMKIVGYEPPDSELTMTKGYYVASAWSKYCNDGETQVCDKCMFSDERYIADYGQRNPCDDCGIVGDVIYLGQGRFGCSNGVDCLDRIIQNDSVAVNTPATQRLTGVTLVCPSCGRRTSSTKAEGGFLTPSNCFKCSQYLGPVRYIKA